LTDKLEAAPRLAAIVFARDEEPEPPVLAFIAAAARRGVRVAGLVQGALGDARRRDLCVRDLATGETLPIMQDLGAEASVCAVDPAAIAEAARLLQRAVATRPDLLVVNRFGRLEAEGGGMLAEIAGAFADRIALLVCLPVRYRDAWNAFAGGLDSQLPPNREAIEAWWAMVEAEISRESA
jgi:hypothetical protein